MNKDNQQERVLMLDYLADLLII